MQALQSEIAPLFCTAPFFCTAKNHGNIDTRNRLPMRLMRANAAAKRGNIAAFTSLAG
jgi:hypothetical protein